MTQEHFRDLAKILRRKGKGPAAKATESFGTALAEAGLIDRDGLTTPQRSTRRGRSRGSVTSHMDDTFSLGEVAKRLHVDFKTLKKMMGEAGIVAERDPNDMRRRIINTNDIRRLQERL